MVKMTMACCLKYLQITFSWWIFSLSCIQAAQPLPLSDKTQAEGSEGLSSPLKKYDTYSAKEYFYEVPKAWEVQFHRVVSNLSQLLGGYDIDIVAWPSWRAPPLYTERGWREASMSAVGMEAAGRDVSCWFWK